KRQTRFIKSVFGTTRRLRNEPLRTITSTMKTLLLPLGISLLIAIVYHSSSNSGYTDDTERNAVELQVIRRRRTIKPFIESIHCCKLNQYYDQEEGRCLGVPGGGKVLHVENRRSCGLNVLKPHCKSSLYYHICKRGKSILAQCASRQIFDNRLQRCVYYDSSKLTPNIIPPDSYMYFDRVRVPSCTRSGRFPVLGHCSMFYTCDTNGHRFYQSVFKCPQNTGYQVDRGVCNVVPDCQNNNSVDTVCVPDAPGENVESPSVDEAEERNVKETSEILDESTASVDDPIVEKKENVNSKIYDDIIITTPGSITGTLLENNDNDSNMEVSDSVKEVLVPDGINEEIMHSQVPNLPEPVQKTSDEGQNEENGSSSLLGLRITPSTTELNDAPHSITTSMTSIKPEYRANADVDSETTDTAPFSSGSYILSKLNKATQDVTTEQYKNIEDSTMTLSNFNTEAIDPAPAINAPEFPPISDVSPNIDKKMQDAPTEQYINEDSAVIPPNFNTDSVDSYSIPTISDVPESPPISEVSPNIDEKMQDVPTEQYKNNEDSAVIPPNLNTDSIDSYSAPTVSNVPESPPISEVSPNIDEKMQDVPTEQYKNNEDSAVIPPNFNTDPYLASTISNVPESSPISEVSPNIDEKMQDVPTEQYKNNEDSAVIPPNFNTDPYLASTINPYLASTVSDVPESPSISEVSPNVDEKMQDVPMEQYKNNEDSAVIPSNLNTDSIDSYSAPTVSEIPESPSIRNVSLNIDEKIQDAPTEQYKNDGDSAVIPPNFSTDSVDSYLTPTISNVPESSPISDVSPNINEEIQNVPTEQYKNNEDSTVIPSNFNTDSVDPYLTPTISDVPESPPISEVSPNIDEKMQDVPTEQYKNNEDSAVIPSNFNTDSVDPYLASTVSDVPESPPISEVSPNIDEKMQDVPTEQYKNNEDSTVIPSNFDTDSVDPYLTPTISDVPESPPISEVSPNIDEKMQDVPTEQYKNNEDSAVIPSNFNTDSVDPYLASTVSDVPESPPISEVSPNIDEKMQDVPTEQYKNNEDSTVIPSNFDTDSVDPYLTPTISDVPESPPISEVSPNIDEKMQDAPTEPYKNNEEDASNFNTEIYSKDDSAVTLPNSNTEVVDPHLTSALDYIPATTDSPRNDDFDVLSSTSTPVILPSQTAIDQLTTEGSLEAIPSIDSKLADTSLSTPDEVESISTYSPENTDDLYLTPTPRSTLISKEITAPLDIATTIPSIQDPSISDTDLVMQNGQDSIEAPASFTE
ncbi:uncharacterized protein, partial [Temnothorax nylanderi]|uniref:uncharacterized protein n=1 Tax=Temnothorax nylanderi TaxID=102681 RepID=UPI003A87B90E